jgi:protein involved in polysaccharide export with SLBB domain
MNMLDNTRDSLDLSKLDISDTYFVGINLEEALLNPGGSADIIIQEGDELLIPEYINTIKISGNVLYPNVVTYTPGMSVKDYVDMAGGYGFNSKKNKSYIVYVNGTVARARKNSHSQIEPGCEIIVPQKARKEGSLEKFLSIATTASSIGTMLATVANIILR